MTKFAYDQHVPGYLRKFAFMTKETEIQAVVQNQAYTAVENFAIAPQCPPLRIVGSPLTFDRLACAF